MEGIWVVLSKTAVITWLIVLVSGSILAIVSGIVEYRDLKKGKAESEKESLEEPEEEKDILETAITEQTGGGIVTECSASKRCAAVTGILELEREREQLRKEYDGLRERYKNLRLECDGKSEALKSLEEDYRALEEADNKLTEEHKELKKENEAHWRQLTQLMRSNPEVFEQFSGDNEIEQELIDNGYVVK
ncbi:MAG: hypothetical protein ACLS4Z_11715 [Christensenellaceae bacterium]